MKKKWLILQLTAVACLATAHAQADQLWTWSFSGPDETGAGTLTTAGPAISPEDILSFSGTVNGAAILGLVPVGAAPTFTYDNKFSATAPHLSLAGILYNVAGTGYHNLFGFPDMGYTDMDSYILPSSDVSVNHVNFSAQAVPEPGSYLMLVAGMGLIAAAGRMRSRRWHRPLSRTRQS